MGAIFKREFSSYFRSPIGYVFIAFYLLFSGAFFYLFTLSAGTADLSAVFTAMFYVLMIFVPILTMRLMSEDNRQKTDQLTLTAPISLLGLVIGKFFAAYAIFLIGTSVMLIYAVVLSFFTAVSWSVILGNLVALMLVGAIFCASGLFISTLTENQMIAAIGSMALNIAIFLMDLLASVIPVELVSDIISAISVNSKYTQFTIGLFSLTSVVYFVSVTFIFLFLTVRVLEKRRWA